MNKVIFAHVSDSGTRTFKPTKESALAKFEAEDEATKKRLFEDLVLSVLKYASFNHPTPNDLDNVLRGIAVAIGVQFPEYFNTKEIK